jgi:hypothetical protein
VDRAAYYHGGHDDDPATETVELLDLGAANPGWQYVAPMAYPRVMPDGVLLPDGTVLVLNGSSTGRSDKGVDPVLAVELYDPAHDTWTELAPCAVPRLYHSTALLLPDGRVMTAGKDGQFQRDPYKYYEHRLEIFSPPYLFKGPRPVISGAPATGAYGATIQVASPAPADAAGAALIRAGAVTHNFNMDQRFVGLEVLARGAGDLTLRMPPNGNVAPPGWYMLFLLSAAGVPSVARMIRLG